MSILGRFTEYTALKLINQKFAIIIGSVDLNMATLQANDLGIQLSSLPIKYMGIPLCTSWLNAKECLPLFERVTTRIQSWKSRLLSHASRLEMVRLVMSSFCTYQLSSFILPKSTLYKLNAITINFYGMAQAWMVE